MSAELSHSKILQHISRHSQLHPDKIAIYSVTGEKVSYAELMSNIRRAAKFLNQNGIGRNDRILLSAQKEVEFIYFYFAAHLSGVINVVVDAKNNANHIDFIASEVKPKLSIGCHTDQFRNFEYNEIILPDKGYNGEANNFSENDTADIMFTSGTTGKPKGVRLSHLNIFTSAKYINSFIGNGSNDCELLGLPICHSFGLGRLRCTMLTGASIVLHNGFANLKSVFDTIEKFNVSGFGMVPAIWAYIKKFSGSRIGKYANQLRYIEIGSAAMPLADKQMLMDLFPNSRICMHYGLTEASRSIFTEFHSAKHLEAVGHPVSEDLDIRIFDDNGQEVGKGHEGEICIKGQHVTIGYLRESDNESAFYGDFFRTGDWGKIGDDGEFYLVARKKELINVGGKKVSPVEIEDALESLGVKESMCVAIDDPEGILGEIPKVLLVKDTFSISIDEIKMKLKDILEPFKLPRIYEVVNSIPKTSSGKKKRTSL